MIKIGKYEFSDPIKLDDIKEIPGNRAGIYVITDNRGPGNNIVIDVGQSSELGTRLDDHDRRPCWDRIKEGTLLVYIKACPASEGWTKEKRLVAEKDLRKEYGPRCGDR